MKNAESLLQIACIRWFSLAHSRLWEDCRLHAVPNGGARNAITGAILKKEGVRRGVWDMQLTVPKNGKAGLWVEMKVRGNTLTKEQQQFRDAHADDYAFAVCYTLDEFMAAVNGYLSEVPVPAG